MTGNKELDRLSPDFPEETKRSEGEKPGISPSDPVPVWTTHTEGWLQVGGCVSDSLLCRPEKDLTTIEIHFQ
jgi:hypothetical protein